MRWGRASTPPPEVAVEVEPPRPPLTDSERSELSARWSQMVCIFCGAVHPGLCNRVRRVELDEAGRPRKTVFWDHWEQNARSIWPEDVWTSPAEMASEMERQARQRANELEIQRAAAREAERLRREQSRGESPRELAARVTRGG